MTTLCRLIVALRAMQVMRRTTVVEKLVRKKNRGVAKAGSLLFLVDGEGGYVTWFAWK